MPFVKIDCDILTSTLWFQRDQREVFLTALLMAEPYELSDPEPVFEVRSLEPAGWDVPAGLYGFVRAAGIGIVRWSGLETEPGIGALVELCGPDPESRSKDFEGRRLARIDGGYIVLNYWKFRERDYTAAARQARAREKKKAVESRRDVTESRRDITQAEAEAEEYTPPLASLEAPHARAVGTKAHPGAVEDVRDYWNAKGLRGSPDAFHDHFVSVGWRTGKGPGKPIKDWQAAARTWSAREPASSSRAVAPRGIAEGAPPPAPLELCPECRHVKHPLPGHCMDGCRVCQVLARPSPARLQSH